MLFDSSDIGAFSIGYGRRPRHPDPAAGGPSVSGRVILNAPGAVLFKAR